LSSKKDKLIEEAQKLALRGQTDKAIKAYEQVLALDPSGINHRQKMAELLVRANRNDDARSEFETIGKHFANNGFYLKAIAVYKQIQKLFPKDISITLSLADLNAKHGLVGNALAEFKLVHDYHEKAGNVVEALKILDRMQQVDPQNINIKLKLAEAYYSNDKKDDSYAVFSKLATLLQERGDTAAFTKLNTRIQQLFPEKSAFMLEVLAEQVASGNAGNAVNGLQAMLRTNPNEKRIWELIVEAYRRLKQPQRVKVAYQHFLKFFPNELPAKTGLLECLAAERDVKGALSLLDRFDQDFIAAGAYADLERIYVSLDEIDPINVRILEGLRRCYEGSGNATALESLRSKIESLQGITGDKKSLPPVDKSSPAHAAPDLDAVFVSSQDAEFAALEPVSVASTDELLVAGELVVEEVGEVTTPEAFPLTDELEIEVEIDEELGFGDETANASTETMGEDWLDSVGELFDTITTSPRGVKFGNDMDSSDAQSHYDLGVAFKEMGLFDEAINEFRQAALEPTRRVECLILQGACLRERGELAMAENVLSSLMKPGLSLEDACAVKYELALTFEVCGKSEQASALLNEIDSVNPGFRDVRSRLDAVGGDNSLEFSDEDLQGFDLK